MDVEDFLPHPSGARLLEGRVALVTGATGGIGCGTVLELAAHGAAVAIDHRRNDKQARTIAESIERHGGRAITVALDVTDEEQVAAAFRTAGEQLGPVDVLVANAGVEAKTPLVELELEEWDKVLRVNLTGAFLCAREVARGLLAAGRSGAIIFMSSVHEVIPWPQYSHYCASKGGMKLFAQTIARELAPHGIRVATVAPGAIKTPINEDVLQDRERYEAVLNEIPWGRWGEVEDVARAVAWLASEQAGYIVGSTVFVDGGMTLYPNFV